MSEPVQISNPVETLDRLLKFVSFCAAIAAIIGFWALWTQFSNLGAPPSLLSLQDAAKAGLLPTLVLAAGGLLAYSGYRYREDKSAMTWLSYALMGLAFGLAILLILPGFIVGVPWIFHFPVELVGSLVWDGYTPFRGLLISFALGLIGFIGTAIDEKWGSQFRAYLARKAAKPEVSDKTASASRSTVAAEPVPQQTDSKDSTSPVKPGDSLSEIAFASVFGGVAIFIYAAWSLASLRWLGHVLESPIPIIHTLANGDIWRSAMVFAIFVSTMAGIGYLIMEARNAQSVAIWSAIVAALIVVGFTIFFAKVAFPLIPSALGGGRVETLTLWLDPDQLPEQLVNSGTEPCKAVGKLVRCDTVAVLQFGDYLIFPASNGKDAATVIKSDTVKALKGR